MKAKINPIRNRFSHVLWIPLLTLSLLVACTQNNQKGKTTDLPTDGSVLPFPEPASASVTGKTLKDSKHQWRKAEKHLPEDAPNIVIFMTDDAGFANPSTFGGPINTPTMERLANSGICYNEFHTLPCVLLRVLHC